MDYIEMQSFSERDGDAEHPFFTEVEIFRHIGHGHIAAHENGGGGFGKRGRLEKIELALLHFLYAVVIARGRESERERRHLNLLKMNGFDIFIEVEGIEMREKFGDGLGIALLCGAQPLHEERSVVLGLCRLLCGCTDERAEGFFLVVFQAPPCDIAADLRDEFLCVCGFSLSGADAGEVGCVEIHGAGKLCVADAECGEQVFKVLNGAVKIGFFGIYELDDHLERIPQVKSDIAKLKKDGAEIIVAVFHWSNELVTVPDENQVTLAHLAIDEGADVVIGHHPHIIQGISGYKGKTIAYSLGNFCFGGNKNPTDKNTAIYQQTFNFLDGQLQPDINACIIPCTLSSTQSANDFQPTVAENGKKQEIIDLMNTYSQNYSNIGFYEDGKLYVNTDLLEELFNGNKHRKWK